MKQHSAYVCVAALLLAPVATAFAPSRSGSILKGETLFRRTEVNPVLGTINNNVVSNKKPGPNDGRTKSPNALLSYYNEYNDPYNQEPEPRNDIVLNWGLVRRTVITQGLIGLTIWTGGYGAEVLARDASWTAEALLYGAVGTLPLFAVSRLIETSEDPAVADLNLSTNLLVLRLFGDKPQPLVAFPVSAFLAGLTGLVEETTFRGMLIPQITKYYDDLPAGVIFSTLLFAFFHVNPLGLRNAQAVLDAFVLILYHLVTGSIFCGLYLSTGNLAVPIISHALFDFYVFYVTHLNVTSQMQYAKERALMPVTSMTVEDFWQQRRGYQFLTDCRETFYLADSNRDGTLSREELRIALYSYGIELTAEESRIVAEIADTDRSGGIDFQEFLEFVGPTGSPGRAIKNSLLGSDRLT